MKLGKISKSEPIEPSVLIKTWAKQIKFPPILPLKANPLKVVVCLPTINQQLQLVKKYPQKKEDSESAWLKVSSSQEALASHHFHQRLFQTYRKVKKWCKSHSSSLLKPPKSNLLPRQYGLHTKSTIYWKRKWSENHKARLLQPEKNPRETLQKAFKNGLKWVSSDSTKFPRLKCSKRSTNCTPMRTLTDFWTILRGKWCCW